MDNPMYQQVELFESRVYFPASVSSFIYRLGLVHVSVGVWDNMGSLRGLGSKLSKH